MTRDERFAELDADPVAHAWARERVKAGLVDVKAYVEVLRPASAGTALYEATVLRTLVGDDRPTRVPAVFDPRSAHLTRVARRTVV